MTDEAPIADPAEQQLQLQLKLESIFMPEARKQRDRALRTAQADLAAGDARVPVRFVHYTSAEAALNIIRSKRLWMRNATCMADYREVQHGFDMINKFFSDQAKMREFAAALDGCVPGGTQEAIAFFNQWWNDIRFNTYITSVSEHDKSEDQHGRLSMWRAFGGNTARVALVFSVPWYSGAAETLNIIFSPVAYLTEEEAHAVIHSVIGNVRENAEFLRSLDRKLVVASLFVMFLAGVTCLKHEGFREEREWRAIYSPKRAPSALMEGSIEVVASVPQPVFKLPLDARVSEALAGIDLARTFDRLIIGPSPYPWALFEAFTDALNRAGVPDAGNRVFTSGIPIRA